MVALVVMVVIAVMDALVVMVAMLEDEHDLAAGEFIVGGLV